MGVTRNTTNANSGSPDMKPITIDESSLDTIVEKLISEINEASVGKFVLKIGDMIKDEIDKIFRIFDDKSNNVVMRLTYMEEITDGNSKEFKAINGKLDFLKQNSNIKISSIFGVGEKQ
ncbi:hypothetical protein JTB14_019308 [Gonioctena quinquepunctata]|nr:hypothetical protein JTB14_019308 [Gonioctena quinquepunctata]